MRLWRLIILALMCLTGNAARASETRTWEAVERLPGQAMEQMSQQEDVSVAVVDGYVYVTLRQRTNLGLFTILGQPLARGEYQPGSYRFRIARRGIYLLKAGPVIRRLIL